MELVHGLTEIFIVAKIKYLQQNKKEEEFGS